MLVGRVANFRNKKKHAKVEVDTDFKSFRPKSNLEVLVWCHQSITGLMSQTQFAPKCLFFCK